MHLDRLADESPHVGLAQNCITFIQGELVPNFGRYRHAPGMRSLAANDP